MLRIMLREHTALYRKKEIQKEERKKERKKEYCKPLVFLKYVKMLGDLTHHVNQIKCSSISLQLRENEVQSGMPGKKTLRGRALRSRALYNILVNISYFILQTVLCGARESR